MNFLKNHDVLSWHFKVIEIDISCHLEPKHTSRGLKLILITILNLKLVSRWPKLILVSIFNLKNQLKSDWNWFRLWLGGQNVLNSFWPFNGNQNPFWSPLGDWNDLSSFLLSHGDQNSFWLPSNFVYKRFDNIIFKKKSLKCKFILSFDNRCEIFGKKSLVLVIVWVILVFYAYLAQFK